MSQTLEPRRRRRIDLEAELLKARAEEQLQKFQESGDKRLAQIYAHAMAEATEKNNPALLAALGRMKRVPVTIDEFIDSPEFLGDLIDIYPAVRDDLRRINPDVLVGEAPVYEAIFGGAIGTAKTTTAIITTLYQTYQLSCFEVPQRLFGLAPSTKLVFAVQSVKPEVTYTAIFEPLRDLVEEMPHAQGHWKWNPRKKKVLDFENGIKIVPVVASVRATAGQAVIGAIQDEANLMAVVERSMRVAGPTGLGGRFDQAQELYRHHTRRRQSRFITQGFSFGTLCVIGSANYQGDFIDRRMEEVERLGEQNVIVIRHSQYEVVPQNRFSGERFRLQVGNAHYPTRILPDEEPAVEALRVERVPVEYKVDFQRDPENALRDIVGIASGVIRPFIARRDKIMNAILAGRELGLRQWVDNPEVDLATDGLPRWNEESLPQDRQKPRYVHMDLALSRDRCGVAIVKLAGMVNESDPQFPDCVQAYPYLVVETAFTIQPSPTAELDMGELRSLLMQLKIHFGLNIRMISFDGYQSREGIQVLRKARIWADEISTDRSVEPYEYVRTALYQDRVAMVESERLMLELSQLELNAEKGKVDHPPRGSKDLADAVAGAVFSASRDRTLRTAVGPVDPDGRRPRPRVMERRSMDRSQVHERPKGRPRRRSNGQVLKEQRETRYRAEWEESQLALKKRYG